MLYNEEQCPHNRQQTGYIEKNIMGIEKRSNNRILTRHDLSLVTAEVSVYRSASGKWKELKYSRKIILFLVIYTNMLDNLLLTCIVPILPEILLDLESKNTIVSIPKDTTYNSSWIAIIKTLHHTKNLTEHGLARKVLPVSHGAIDENSKTGWILSSKALVQIFANPIVGWLSNRFGYTSLFTIGTSILLISVLTSFIPLLLARIVQGLGSAFSTITGMCLLAEFYTDDKDRSRVMGFAMGGVALGVLVGYPYGGFLYSYLGKAAPFLLLSVFIIADIVFQLLFLHPSITYKKNTVIGTSIWTLLRDPYILVATVVIMLTTMSMAILEPTVPIWIIDTMDAKQWQLGLVFLPDSIGYLIGTNCFGIIAQVVGRWLCSMVCMILIGLCLVLIPFATQIAELIIPHFGLGLGLGITDAALMPLLAYLVDTRHASFYGNVYAIAQLAVCLAYGIGPAVGGLIIKHVGFQGLLWGLAAVIFIMSLLCLLLKNPPIKDENKLILEDASVHELLYLDERCEVNDGINDVGYSSVGHG